MIPESTKVKRGSLWEEKHNQTISRHLLTFSKEHFLCKTKRREQSAPTVFLFNLWSLTVEPIEVLDLRCSPKAEQTATTQLPAATTQLLKNEVSEGHRDLHFSSPWGTGALLREASRKEVAIQKTRTELLFVLGPSSASPKCWFAS